MTLAQVNEEAAQPLDYDALYQRYLASLIDDLRGFRAAAPGLELWVPDEDPFTSVRNLLDAASAVGRGRVLLRLSTKTLAAIGDAERLLTMARVFGEAQLARDANGALLDVTGLDVPRSGSAEARPDSSAVASGVQRTAPARVQPVESRAGADAGAREAAALALYRAALEGAAADPRHRGPLARAADGCVLHARVGSAELTLWVDRAHCITTAGFQAEDALEVGLLESLCRIVSGLPLLEAAEHGTLRLERALRAGQRRPVAGIVLPESAHPLFRRARELLSLTLAEYRRQTGFREVHSRHDDRPAEGWLRASDGERRAWLTRVLEGALQAHGVDPQRASIESIRYDVRVELALELGTELDAPVVVMELERALQAAVDPRLELYVTERRDRNAKRRLAVLGDDT